MIARGFRDLGVGLAGICAATALGSLLIGLAAGPPRAAGALGRLPARRLAALHRRRGRRVSATRRGRASGAIARGAPSTGPAELGRGVPPLGAPRRGRDVPRPARRRPPPAGVAVMRGRAHLPSGLRGGPPAASLALDGELDEVGRAPAARPSRGVPRLRGVRSPRCASASELLRRAPRRAVSLRARGRAARPHVLVRTGRSIWPGPQSTVAALVLATGALPGRDDTAAPSPRTAVVAPLELPIGQRSAMDDFAASSTAREPSVVVVIHFRA